MRKAWKEKWIVLRPPNDHDFGYPGYFTAPRTMNNKGFHEILNLKIFYIENILVLSKLHTK